MESVQFIPSPDGFTLLVRPAGWGDQTAFLCVTGITFFLAGIFTYGVFHGYHINDRPAQPFDSIYASPLWIIGLSTLAAAFQRAYRKLIFIADAQTFVIATAGPLRKTSRQFPRPSILAAVVGYSHVIVNDQRLQQLQLFFAGRNAPYCLLTGRDNIELVRIAQYLNESLNLSAHMFRPNQFMEIRNAPIHAKLFTILCGLGTAIAFAAMCFRASIGNAAFGITVFSTILSIIIIFSFLARTCRCPKCHALIKRDNLSPEGYYQYTCPACRIVWQSPIRAGAPGY